MLRLCVAVAAAAAVVSSAAAASDPSSMDFVRNAKGDVSDAGMIVDSIKFDAFQYGLGEGVTTPADRAAEVDAAGAHPPTTIDMGTDPSLSEEQKAEWIAHLSRYWDHKLADPNFNVTEHDAPYAAARDARVRARMAEGLPEYANGTEVPGSQRRKWWKVEGSLPASWLEEGGVAPLTEAQKNGDEPINLTPKLRHMITQATRYKVRAWQGSMPKWVPIFGNKLGLKLTAEFANLEVTAGMIWKGRILFTLRFSFLRTCIDELDMLLLANAVPGLQPMTPILVKVASKLRVLPLSVAMVCLNIDDLQWNTHDPNRGVDSPAVGVLVNGKKPTFDWVKNLSLGGCLMLEFQFGCIGFNFLKKFGKVFQRNQGITLKCIGQGEHPVGCFSIGGKPKKITHQNANRRGDDKTGPGILGGR